MSNFRISRMFHLDRDEWVVEIIYYDAILAEILQSAESGRIQVELFETPRDLDPKLDFNDFMEALQLAKTYLLEGD